MANDSKYGRLYPERAVAPARSYLEDLVAGRNPGPADAVLAKLDELGFPPAEPLFLLRGQDELAPDTVRFYAELVMETKNEALDADALIAFADRMRRWQPRKLPD